MPSDTRIIWADAFTPNRIALPVPSVGTTVTAAWMAQGSSSLPVSATSRNSGVVAVAPSKAH